MKNFITNFRIPNGLLLVFGTILIYLQLKKHPQDWQRELSIMLIVMFLVLSVLYIIYYFKNRNLKN